MDPQNNRKRPGIVGQIISNGAGLLMTAIVLMLLIPLAVPQASFVNIVDGDSMLPTLSDGQLIFTDMSPLGRGDIVIARLPARDNQLVVKRVVAVPGDTLTINADGLYINSQLVDEPYLTEEGKTATYMESGCNYRILAEDEYYLLGDNRAISYDSRYYGPIRESDVVFKQSATPTVNTVVRLFLVIIIAIACACLYVDTETVVSRWFARKTEHTKES